MNDTVLAPPAASGNRGAADARAAGRGWRFACLATALVAALLFLRNPGVVLSPRFLAEEADMFFANAWYLPGAEALWNNLTPRLGYLNLFPIVATWLAAKLVEPEFAAAATLLMIAAVQGAILWLAMFGPRRVLATPLQRGLAAAAILYFPYHTGVLEVWLSAMNAPVHFGVAALLVLLSDEPRESRAVRWASRGLVLAGALTGPYTLLLAPAFLLKWIVGRDRETFVRGACIGAVGLFQAAIAVTAALAGHIEETRSVGTFGPASVYNALIFQVMCAILGEVPSHMLLKGLDALPVPDVGWGPPIVASLVCATVVAVAWRTAPRSLERSLLVLAFATWCVFTMLFAVHGIAAYRYAICPSTALGFLLILAATNARPPTGASVACSILLAAAITTGFLESRMQRAPLRGEGQHAWHEEVRLWRRDPDHTLRAWPSHVWYTHLADPARRDALAAALARREPFALAPGGEAALSLENGLPAYFLFEFEACAEQPATLVMKGLRGEAMQFEVSTELAPGCRVADLNAMNLAFSGFHAFSGVERVVFRVEGGTAPVRLSDFRLGSPLRTVRHPYSGN